MTVLILFFCALLLMPVIIDTLLLLLWLFQEKEADIDQQIFPVVSILVAVRNEEKNIKSCIDALLDLNYPSEKLEIIIGDDDSRDGSFTLIQDYSRKYDYISVNKIIENVPGLKGKANVLAQLGKRAKGEFLFLTDADIQVPRNWISEMLKGFSEKVGVVSGVTGIKGEGYFSLFQCIDWIFALGMAKVVNNMGFSVTALGNNMAIKRDAYDAVGGYENIPFSITEDFEMLKQVQRKGYVGNQLFNKEVLAWSLAEHDFKNLLVQRKRWMKGAVQLPKAMVTILFIQAMFFPILLIVMVINFNLGLFLLIIKIFIQGLFINYSFSKLERNERPISLILYEIYSALLSLSLMLYYILPFSVRWKDREYV